MQEIAEATFELREADDDNIAAADLWIGCGTAPNGAEVEPVDAGHKSSMVSLAAPMPLSVTAPNTKLSVTPTRAPAPPAQPIGSGATDQPVGASPAGNVVVPGAAVIAVPGELLIEDAGVAAAILSGPARW